MLRITPLAYARGSSGFDSQNKDPFQITFGLTHAQC